MGKRLGTTYPAIASGCGHLQCCLPHAKLLRYPRPQRFALIYWHDTPRYRQGSRPEAQVLPTIRWPYLVRTLLQRMHPVRYAQEVLYMVAYLVGYDIGLGKLTRCMETVLQVPIELEVNIDLVCPVGHKNRPVQMTKPRVWLALLRQRGQHQFRVFR